MVQQNVFVLHFDLRNYAIIEKTERPEIVLEMLNKMHNIIDSKMQNINGRIYSVHTDTSVYIVENNDKVKIVSTITEIKNMVDQYFESCNYKSKLFLCCIYDEAFIGDIIINVYKHRNVWGNVMKEFQEIMNIVETTENKEIQNGIVYNEKAAEYLFEYNTLRNQIVDNRIMYFH